MDEITIAKAVIGLATLLVGLIVFPLALAAVAAWLSGRAGLKSNALGWLGAVFGIVLAFLAGFSAMALENYQPVPEYLRLNTNNLP